MKLRFAAALAAAAVLLAPVALAQTGGADQEAIAKRLVAAAGIHEGDLVMVCGGTRDFALLEDIAIQTRATGAHPLVTLWSQRIAHDMFAKAPERYDSQPPALNLKLAESDHRADLRRRRLRPGWSSPTSSPARRAATRRRGTPVRRDPCSARKVRIVNLGSGLYPNAQNAALYGIPQPELEKMFWAGGCRRRRPSSRRPEPALKAALGPGRELRVTHPNGTDLRDADRGPAGPRERRRDLARGGRGRQGWRQLRVCCPPARSCSLPCAGTGRGRRRCGPRHLRRQGRARLEAGLQGEGRVVSMTGRGDGFATAQGTLRRRRRRQGACSRGDRHRRSTLRCS